MKKLLILLALVVSLFLSGCSDSIKLYKQDEIAAKTSCEKNGGYVYYEVRQHVLLSIPTVMEVKCADGAIFTLGLYHKNSDRPAPVENQTELKVNDEYIWKIDK